MTDIEMIRRILGKVRKNHEANPQRKDMERLKAKLFGINSQIEALSERLAELPKKVSAAPIYRQMERLEETKNELDSAYIDLKNGGRTDLDRIVGLETFEDFARHYRRLVLKDLDPAQRKQMIQKFVKRIEVGTETVKIHFIVDQEHYKRESALRAGSPPRGAAFSDFFRNAGSNTLTVGAP